MHRPCKFVCRVFNVYPSVGSDPEGLWPFLHLSTFVTLSTLIGPWPSAVRFFCNLCVSCVRKINCLVTRFKTFLVTHWDWEHNKCSRRAQHISTLKACELSIVNIFYATIFFETVLLYFRVSFSRWEKIFISTKVFKCVWRWIQLEEYYFQSTLDYFKLIIRYVNWRKKKVKTLSSRVLFTNAE